MSEGSSDASPGLRSLIVSVPRDVTFDEDASRIRVNPGIFARLRSFAYNILRINETGSFVQDRYRAALRGVEGLLQLAVC